MQISSVQQINSRLIQFNTNGASGGWNAGYEFRAGANNVYGSTTALRIWANSATNNRIGVGNISESDLQGGSAQVYINSQITGGRNAGIRITPSASSTTQFNGIQFDFNNKDSNGGAFIGSQWNPLIGGYGTDLVILTTNDGINNYLETARFVGKNQSLSLGAGRNPSASLHISGSSGSALLEIDSPAVNNILFVTGSGRVGIGTGTPAYTLDVYGSPRFYGDGNHMYTRIFSGASNKDSKILFGNDSERFNVGLAASSNNFAINSSNGGTPTSINIDYTTGNVLIGTTTDAGYKLDVNGTARVSGVLTAGATINQGFSSSTSNVLLSTHTTAATTNTGIYAPGGNAFGVSVAGNRMAYAVADWQMWGGIMIQAIGVNASLNSSAILQADSTTKGFLPPRMTGAQAELISSPAEGLMVYATAGTGTTITSKGWWGYDGATWVKFN
jgi:hypothetical protein